MKKIMSHIFFDKWGDLRVGWWGAGTVLLILLVSAILLAPVFAMNAAKCSELTNMDQLHTYNWTLWTGCRVLSNDGYWIPVDNLQYNNVSLEEVPK